MRLFKPHILLYLCITSISPFCFLCGQENGNDEVIHVSVNANAKRTGIDRIGINLDDRERWGARQLIRNLIMGPGFEGRTDEIIVNVTRHEKRRFYGEKDWGYEDGYWNGAEFDLRTGPHAGLKGKIVTSYFSGPNGFPMYETDIDLPNLVETDSIVLRKDFNTESLDVGAAWWIAPKFREDVRAVTNDLRPGTKGKQSLLINPTKQKYVYIDYYMDNFFERAGKLINIDGKWMVSLWLKSEGNATVELKFEREKNGSPPFFLETIAPTSEWQQYVYSFEAKDTGNPGRLHFGISVVGQDAKVFLDELTLTSLEEGNTLAFRQPVIDVLKLLRPSFLRSAVMAGSAINQTTGDLERKFVAKRFWKNRDAIYLYSIPEFLDLCEAVNAQPWIIVSTRMTDEDYEELGQYLGSHANKERFPKLILEYGNENWNALFKAQTFIHPIKHGEAFERAFKYLMKGNSGKSNIIKTVNAFRVSIHRSKAFFDHAPSADNLSVAGYFFKTLNRGTTTKEALRMLFERPESESKERIEQIAEIALNKNKQFSIYEVNLHTNKGSAPSSEREPIIAGAASGAALAKRLIDLMDIGADPIMIYALSGYDARTENKDMMKLWGITRDFGPTNRIRPTGLAVEMLNRVIGSEYHPMTPLTSVSDTYDQLTLAAFTNGQQWTAACVSVNSKEVTIALEFPNDGRTLPQVLQTLQANSPLDTNEDSEKVTIKTEPLTIDGSTIQFTIPPHGLVTLGLEKNLR